MKTLAIQFKNKSQVGNGIITAANKLVCTITGGSLEYWNRYSDDRAMQILAEKALQYEYGKKKYNEMIITSIEIN